MHRLDDPGFVTRLDPKGMYALTCAFPAQCEQALEIARGVSLSPGGSAPRLVVLAGLGGSAAGGDLAKALYDEAAQSPMVVVRDYHLPKWVGKDDLVFCSSYSGNTEETLSAYADAKTAGARIVAVTSGGKLAEWARADGHPVIQIPGGQPPRTALGFMLVPVVVASEALGLLPATDWTPTLSLLEACVSDWAVESAFESNPGKQLAAALQNKVSVLYGLGSWQGAVANRWKGQINENAKNLALCSTYPELNHNEILGWIRAGDQGVAAFQGIVLEDGRESAKMRARARVTAQLLEGICPFLAAQARGDSLLQRMLSLTLLGDFVSLYLAALNGVDPENIDWINVLKAELAQVE